MQHNVPVKTLGQSGIKFIFPELVVYVDPYLSNSVQELDAQDLERQVEPPFAPENVTDADWVLITHEHIDHCDPHTLPKLAAASPKAQFMGPAPVIALLKSWGIAESRLHLAEENWQILSNELEVIAVPAAHLSVERDAENRLRFLGFLLNFSGNKIYIAGDTVVCDELINALQAQLPIHTAFLPVNEHNYFKNRRGIVGNMTAREAFQLADELKFKQVVALHWDMFAINSVSPAEIRLIHETLRTNVDLLIEPTRLRFNPVTASIIIRTLNEGRYLDQLLAAIESQNLRNLGVEVIIVDSGSNDATLEIAAKHNCRILHITREEFTFGRSLNMGCAAAKGEVLVITSGHCIPTSNDWLYNLCQPIIQGTAQYVYGRQVGNANSRFSETRIFAKYYPEVSDFAQKSFFCNNANAAISKQAWQRFRFDEQLTGLEDMALAQRLVEVGGNLAYLADAPVLHLHHETWAQVKRRFEREAIALQAIMPQVHVNYIDTARYIVTSILGDLNQARKERVFFSRFLEIIQFRFCQYMGSCKGNHQHRKLSRAEKDKYFFPY